MSYIGKQPEFTQYPSKFFNGDGSAMTVTLDYAPPNDAALLVFIDGVRQDTSAYGCVGTSLTFTGSVPSGTNNVQVVHMGLTQDVGVPGDDTVTTAKIQDDAVTSAKIATDAVGSAEIAANAVGNAEMADDAIGINELSATGTASATTYLRGDNAWTAISEYDDSGLQDDIALLGFRIASNGSLAKYNLVDQTIDDFQDASGVNSGASTYATRDSTGKYYSGKNAATGGTVTTHGSYTVHSFTDTGSTNFVVGAAGNVAVLVVAGGGGGGTYSGGGGGAGGFRTSASHAVTATTYPVTVGAGGGGGTHNAPGDPSGWYEQGENGGNSIFDSITSAGGGGGMGYGDSGSSDGYGGSDGGSGGGGGTTTGAPDTIQGGDGNTPSTSPSQGSAGGTGDFRNYPGAPGNWYGGGGGGGGASAVGVNVQSMTNRNYGGTGGAGTANDYRTGASVTYSGGGGGAGGDQAGSGYGPPASGGAGGGGDSQPHDAAYNGAYVPGAIGTANSGGGGGGGAGANWGGYGGSGIVVVRYPTGDLASDENMILVSNTTAALNAPTKGDIVLTYTNGVGTTTLDTDLTAEISADGGSTWTALALASEGSTGSHNIATSHDVTISSTITAPYNMAYRIKTLNQSATKITRIQAVSLGWS